MILMDHLLSREGNRFADLSYFSFGQTAHTGLSDHHIPLHRVGVEFHFVDCLQDRVDDDRSFYWYLNVVFCLRGRRVKTHCPSFEVVLHEVFLDALMFGCLSCLRPPMPKFIVV